MSTDVDWNARYDSIRAALLEEFATGNDDALLLTARYGVAA